MIKIRSSFKWGILCLLISFLAGSTSALFLVLLDAVTLFRTKNNVLIALLPIAALITVILYQTVGRKSASGNHLIVATILQPSKPLIDWLMAPLILFTTLIAHLSGASVGRAVPSLPTEAPLKWGFCR